MTSFFQNAPALGNQYLDDRMLRSFLARRLPPEMLAEIQPDLIRFGHRVANELVELAREAERHEPEHVPFDPWGRRIDEVRVSAAWTAFDRISAEEGIVAIGYERAHDSRSRIHQFAKLFLFAPSSAVYSCPLAMTDGAARALELYGDHESLAAAYRHLTSREPALFWTSGQWMTERTGGSDVSGTTTLARPIAGEPGMYRLYGDKWFTSATTSQMAMALARIEGAEEGSHGLSLFHLELRDADGNLQGIRVNRLKDKLGTRALPTAELTLDGTRARLVGGPGHGVKKIASLFNITRIYNACCATASMRRGLALARDYARRRVAFGKKLADQPLHLETLAALEVELEAAFLLTFRCVELLGKDECGEATQEETATLRMLTPLAKLYTGRQTVASASEILESFGGAGYVEDTGLPTILRDAQVLSIWEGTTNVLSLDTLRAIERERAFGPFLADLGARLAAVDRPELAPAVKRVREAAKAIETYLANAMQDGLEFVEAGARSFAFSLARTYAGALMCEHANWSLIHERDARAATSALRWCAGALAPLVNADALHRQESRALALGEVLPAGDILRERTLRTA